MNRPFIKLLRTPSSGYFYDVGKNEIVRVNDQLFSYLKGMVAGAAAEADADTLATVAELQEAGYLSARKPETIRHPYTNLLPLFLERKVEKITLQLTQDCNFRCKYCIYSEETNVKQRTHTKKSMSWETAKKAIDFYLDHSVDSLKRNIGLYGGEPLLQFELLKRIVLYAEERMRGKPLTFSMTTNGSLLTDEIVAFLAEHNVDTLISLDGPKEVNDKNRVFKTGGGTYDTVVRNLHRIKEKYPQYMRKIRLNMVIDPENDFDCINAVTVEWQDIDIADVLVNLVYNTDTPISIPIDFSMKSEYQAFLAYLSYFGHYPKEKLSPMGRGRLNAVQNDIGQFSPAYGMGQETAPGGPCIPGRVRMLVNADGKLFPCERVNESDIMCIGTLDDGFDLDKARELLNIGALTADTCKNCWAIRHCTMCARMADAGDRLSAETKRNYCAGVIASAEAKLRGIILLKEIPEYYKDLVQA